MKTTAPIDSNDGFTMIECLIALFVAALFITSFALLTSSIVSASATARNRSDASDLAYSYLRNYAYVGSSPGTFFTCNNNDDFAVNSNATGSTIASGSVTSSTLPKNVFYTVVGLAPYGCSGSNVGTPVEITATVRYGATSSGTGGTTVSHATYVGY